MLEPSIPRCRGSVFILVLWVVAFLATLTLAMSNKVSQDIHVAAYQREKISARVIAISAVKKAQSELGRRNVDADTLKDAWSTGRLKDGGISIFEDIPQSGGKYSLIGSDVRSGMVDEERKINVNTASVETLKRLVQMTGGLAPEEAKKIAESLVDWRDADDIALEGGSEVGYYGSRDKPFVPRNGPIRFLEELRHVRGMNDPIYAKLREAVTVFGDGKVNINTAPLPVLVAIGFDEPLAKKILRYRNGADNLEATQDDPVINDLSTLAEKLRYDPGLSLAEQTQILSVTSKGLLITASKNFTILAEARFGKRIERILCVTDKNRQIKFWRE